MRITLRHTRRNKRAINALHNACERHYDRLNQNMLVIDVGINWFLNEHNTKLSLNVQNRPVFILTNQQVVERKNMVVAQLQVAI